MAVETARKFLELLTQDSTLQTQYLVTEPQTADEVVQFASAKGFIVSEEEMRVALNESSANGLREKLREQFRNAILPENVVRRKG